MMGPRWWVGARRQLPQDNEGLRDTIFHALYGSMVMFDTNSNAFRYQKACKSNGQLPLPVLVKEDGTVLVRDSTRAGEAGAAWRVPPRAPRSIVGMAAVGGIVPV